MKRLRPVQIGDRKIGDGYPTYVVAEIGQNHNGSVAIADKLIDLAANQGVDAVKLTKRDIRSDLTLGARNAPHSNPEQSYGETYGEHRRALELPTRAYRYLRGLRDDRGYSTELFATVCDVSSLRKLEPLNLPAYKIASRDITNLPLIDAVARTGKTIILSGGMADLERWGYAIRTVRHHHNRLIALHCKSKYPTDAHEVNLSAMKTIRTEFDVLVGYSDHTVGIKAPIAAVSLGACMIEKHVTLDRRSKGTDHEGALAPDGLRRLMRDIREVEDMIGDGLLLRPDDDDPTRVKLERSIVSRVRIPAGTKIEERHITLKSPGNGVNWLERGDILGKYACVDIPPDVTIHRDRVTDLCKHTK